MQKWSRMGTAGNHEWESTLPAWRTWVGWEKGDSEHYTAPDVLKWVRMGRHKTTAQIGFSSCRQVGRGCRAALPDEPGWGHCLQGPVILLTLPPASVSFPRGETNLFPIFYHSCLIRFQVLKGTNCFIPCISVACRRGRNYSWLEFLGSTLIQRCWNSSPGFRQNSKVCVCLLLCWALGHKLQ